jgi:beta-1,4-N-acetylglucosaminyltransferase
MAVWVVLAALALLRLVLEMALRSDQQRRKTVRTMVVLGSGERRLCYHLIVSHRCCSNISRSAHCVYFRRPGGHTAEMLALLRGMDLGDYTPRRYVVATTDAMSGPKAAALEQERTAAQRAPTEQQRSGAPPPPPSRRRSPRKALPTAAAAAKTYAPGAYTIITIPRSREVGQSFPSSVWSTLHAARAAAAAVLSFRPDLLLTNGPGTALPLCAVAVLARVAGLARCRVVYVESVARVRRLSLTGRLLYALRLTDEFLVQWEELAKAHPRATFAGRLM